MVPFFYSSDVTAYFRVRRVEDLYEGLVDVLHGKDPVRTEHRCRTARPTEQEALRDARRDASMLVKALRGGRA